MLGAAFTSFGGMLMTMTSASGDPKIGVDFTMNAIAAAVIGGTLLSGGRGTIAGAVAGAVTLRLIGNLLFSLGLNGYWQYVVIGTILIAALGVPYLIGRARAILVQGREGDERHQHCRYGSERSGPRGFTSPLGEHPDDCATPHPADRLGGDVHVRARIPQHDPGR